MSIFALADLEMLICEKDGCTQYSDFYERILRLTDTYNQWVENSESLWLFSDNLIDLLWYAYPWDSDIHHHTDLINVFSTWIQTSRKQKVQSQNISNLYLEPDLYTYANIDYSELTDEWLNILARNIEIDRAIIVIFSCDGTIFEFCQFKPDEIRLFNYINNQSLQFPVLKREDQWEIVLANDDPWLRHQLPRDGDFPYIPDKSYREGATAFPHKYYVPRDAVGYIDIQGRIWVPDEERGQRHWDVQCRPFSRDNYFKVSPDGRLLGKRRPC